MTDHSHFFIDSVQIPACLQRKTAVRGIGYMKMGIGFRVSGIGMEEDFDYKEIFSTFSPYTLYPKP